MQIGRDVANEQQVLVLHSRSWSCGSVTVASWRSPTYALRRSVDGGSCMETVVVVGKSRLLPPAPRHPSQGVTLRARFRGWLTMPSVCILRRLRTSVEELPRLPSRQQRVCRCRSREGRGHKGSDGHNSPAAPSNNLPSGMTCEDVTVNRSMASMLPSSRACNIRASGTEVSGSRQAIARQRRRRYLYCWTIEYMVIRDTGDDSSDKDAEQLMFAVDRGTHRRCRELSNPTRPEGRDVAKSEPVVSDSDPLVTLSHNGLGLRYRASVIDRVWLGSRGLSACGSGSYHRGQRAGRARPCRR
ncbi:hypothetical protein CC85DRAFT_47654 [Cutaneotrichosporon oleaginosum]|uniref:Uncharacterized protein n=1 Tax=Cutaneotrichosporon oleaginosum TaxID=879819 RepID=A0A0J0XQX0_9TREE|nr:uncharacterized protein CC85DRAFT_47654 [Cutaneotrichosporon oleaginosum]KLT43483.1 hypothetical protein CC85DRAFT_47654 [Cutaneotrichosporon oleaginosum]TXT05614.1 hypothetical protein COLE_06934 [Cutaneotrichosporon oleaginosum]